MRAPIQATEYNGLSGKRGEWPRAAACRKIIPHGGSDNYPKILLNRPESQSILCFAGSELFEGLFGFRAISSNKGSRSSGAERFFPEKTGVGHGRQLVWAGAMSAGFSAMINMVRANNKLKNSDRSVVV
jgi:hypothetical protein